MIEVYPLVAFLALLLLGFLALRLSAQLGNLLLKSFIGTSRYNTVAGWCCGLALLGGAVKAYLWLAATH